MGMKVFYSYKGKMRPLSGAWLWCCLALGLIMLVLQAQAQTAPAPEFPIPSVPIETSTYSYTASEDTIPADTTKHEDFLNKLKQFSKKKTIFGRLAKVLFVFTPKVNPDAGGLNTQLLPVANEQHNYKVVRNISFKVLDAFGYSIHDTTRVPKSKVERFGNALHARSRRSMIRNKLLFKQGDLLMPLELSESERLLRETSYILDARILVNEATSTQDSVDILVITKDVFSISGSGSLSTGGGRLSLRDLNFLGLGHQIRSIYRFGVNEPQTWLLEGAYTIENLYRTYITADLLYHDDYYNKIKSISFYRDFYTTNTRYAGGLSVSWNKILEPLDFQDTSRVYGVNDYHQQDVWLGRSFRLKTYDLNNPNAGRFITAVRFQNLHYNSAVGPIAQTARLYLAAFGYSFRRYYKDQYIFGFGRTEDIPAGNLFSLTAGYEDGERKQRPYFGVKTAFGKYRPSFGYLYGAFEYGSYRYNGNWEQGALSAEGLYFTPLYRINNWRWRHFLSARTSMGYGRSDYYALDINQDNGIRGFRSYSLRGYRRFVLNYETNLFTPLTLFGFRLAVVGFADFAWVTSKPGGSPFSEKPYQGVGLGLRFRNEYLAINTIQFMVGYYPRMPANETLNDIKILHNSRPYYEFNNLHFTQPLIMQLR